MVEQLLFASNAALSSVVVRMLTVVNAGVMIYQMLCR
jgi:hypothetical protein